MTQTTASTRRRLLLAGASAAAATVAGCLASPNDEANGTGGTAAGLSGSAAFFTLMDWANQVGGDVVQFETPVEVGQMGHGWSPDGDIVPQLAQHDVFLYLDTPEFQWAVDIAAQLRDEDEHDVVVIDGMAAIPRSDLLPFVREDEELLPPPDTDVDWDPTAVAIGEFDVVSGDEVAAWWHGDHWHGGIPDVPVGEPRRLRFTVTDEAGNVLPLGEERPFEVVARVDTGAPDDLVRIENRGDIVELVGEAPGQTLLVFEVRGDGEVLFDTTPDPVIVTVTEADEIDIDVFHDPHVWVDPVHAQTMVDHIATELGTAFPDHEATFGENAAAYVDRLGAVDQQFRELADEATREVAVLVAHDAFQYIEDRYGFELRTPVGVTPDAAESLADIAELGRTIEEHELDTILFDPFEAPNPGEDLPQAAKVLLEDTRAEHAEPLTPAEGIIPEWREAGYGWVEQMEEINLPSLRQALHAR